MPRLLDPDFKYTSSAATSIGDTWRRFGFKPTTDAERKARRKPKEVPANVRQLRKAAK